jgi:hypothetical protein
LRAEAARTERSRRGRVKRRSEAAIGKGRKLSLQRRSVE